MFDATHGRSFVMAEFLHETSAGWYNDTQCDSSTTAPGCTTTAGSSISNSSTIAHAIIGSRFRWNGSTALTTWTDGTRLVALKRYFLWVELYPYTLAGAFEVHPSQYWPAQSGASIHAARPGTFLQLNSFTVQ